MARHLRENGIETGVHYPVPNHRQPAIAALYSDLPTLPRTQDWTRKILSLPMHPQLTTEQIKTVAQAIKAYFSS